MKFGFKKDVLMSLIDGNTGGGGAGGDAPKGDAPKADAPAAGDAPKADAPKADAPKADAPKKYSLEEWKDALPDELKNDPSIKSLKDVAALAKSYIHGQKLIGADKIVVPSNLTSDEEWGKIYQKLGMPESPDKYEFKAPEGTDKEFTEDFKKIAHAAGILPKQAEKLFDWYDKKAQELNAADEASEKQKFEQAVDGLKKEWGQAYDRKLSNVNGLFNQMADDATKKFMQESGFGNHPAVLKLFSKIADSFGEAKFIAPGGNGNMGLTPAEAEQKLNELYKQTATHPYFLKAHPKHSEARAEVATWHAAVAAGKKR
jgi:hypothetical protein